MKILQINRFWRRHGNPEGRIFEMSRMLAERGHEIIPFAMKDEDNEPSRYSSLFVSPVQMTDPLRVPFWKRATIAARILYSKESRNRISVLADMTSPDVAHLHNIYHHLSPSILPALKDRGIGTVMTLHDYKLFCPALRQYNLTGLCEECRPFHYSGSISGKCVKNSLASSLLCATEMFLHDLFELYTANVDTFIVPSGFVAAKLEVRGIPADKIEIIPAFVDSDFWQPGSDPGSDDFVLYAGRLTPEKGIMTMIETFAALPHITLKIAGSGMLHGHAKRLADSLGAENIEFLGFRQPDEVLELMQNCRFVLMPSEWNENTPRSLLEAFSCGKSAVATRIGGLPEIAREGETALLAEPANAEDLARAVESLWRDEERAEVMGRNARELAVSKFSSEVHFDKLLSVYEEIKRI